ncbi:MAG: Asp23/Gls24 family envelope stress response protein [Oscillospiraceae bacterium]|jgi:uncharacterized alkaline shock family protein YloU|nr:Asp23/Gls24 family envelope stress response protein [Oscillospiraceae bacterium]
MGHHDESVAGLVISDEVLAAIAITTAKGISGVSALVPRPMSAGRIFRQKNGKAGGSNRYVKIVGSEAELLLELSLRVRANAKISTLAAEVQRSVKTAVQSMTGKSVARVNLRVIGADF